MRDISLSELTDGYSLAVRIEGQEYHFGELPIAALGRLQTFIERELPNPFDAIKLLCLRRPPLMLPSER